MSLTCNSDSECVDSEGISFDSESSVDFTSTSEGVESEGVDFINIHSEGVDSRQTVDFGNSDSGKSNDSNSPFDFDNSDSGNSNDSNEALIFRTYHNFYHIFTLIPVTPCPIRCRNFIQSRLT